MIQLNPKTHKNRDSSDTVNNKSLCHKQLHAHYRLTIGCSHRQREETPRWDACVWGFDHEMHQDAGSLAIAVDFPGSTGAVDLWVKVEVGEQRLERQKPTWIAGS